MKVQRARHNKLFIFSKGCCLPYYMIRILKRPLEDHTTEHLMAQFYAQLAHHERKVDALRAAQLELLDKGVPPYYWASFQVVGDPNGTL